MQWSHEKWLIIKNFITIIVKSVMKKELQISGMPHRKDGSTIVNFLSLEIFMERINIV